MTTDRMGSLGPIRQVPVGAVGAGPYAITAGPDGALWITLVHAGQIARLDPAGRLDIHELDSPTCRPAQITTGPDGALWFTRPGDDRIGRTTPSGNVTELAQPTTNAMASMITTGPDRALWFTLNQAHAIGRLSVDGKAKIHPLPTPDAGPVGITATPDTVWFVEIAASQVGRINPNGWIEEFALPDRNAQPHAIVADPGQGCWLSEWGTSRIAHITTDGDVNEIALPASSEPHGLTIGPDGALWVALETGTITQVRDIESVSRMVYSVLLDAVAELESRNVAVTAGFRSTKQLLAGMPEPFTHRGRLPRGPRRAARRAPSAGR